MKKKGTAVDVAIAVLVCNGAIHAHSLGIGGGFAMTIFIKSEARSYFLNAREMAPLVSNKTMFTNKPKASTEGPLSVAVPGIRLEEMNGTKLSTIKSIRVPSASIRYGVLPLGQ